VGKVHQESQLLQQLSDEVWGEVQQGLSGFEGVLGGYAAAAWVSVDVNAAVFGESGDYEDVAWRQFAAARKKQQLGLL
jgi:hypothetical protein